VTNEYNEDNLIIGQIIDDHGNREVLTMKFDEKGRYVEFIKAENATLIGAAIAGLTN